MACLASGRWHSLPDIVVTVPAHLHPHVRCNTQLVSHGLITGPGWLSRMVTWGWVGIVWTRLWRIVGLSVWLNMRCLNAGQAVATIIIHCCITAVFASFSEHDTIHPTLIANMRFIIIVVSKATHACAPSSTATLALSVSGKSISTGELAITLWTDVWTLTSVEFGVTLQIVKSTKSHITRVAYERLLLTVCQQVTLEVVLARKLCITMRTLICFRW